MPVRFARHFPATRRRHPNRRSQAAAPLLRTEDANLSQVVSARAMEDLPVNGRNILNLTALDLRRGAAGHHRWKTRSPARIFSPPGIIRSAGRGEPGGGLLRRRSRQPRAGESGEHGAEPGRDCGVPCADQQQQRRIRALRRRRDQYLSRSGTNQLHGSAYEYFRNDVLNATNFFAIANNTGKPAFKQNQYGLNGGGPVKKNRIFFFAGWEAFRGREGSPYIATVPLPEMYTGDFSNFRNAANAIIPIYDPLTQCGTGGNSACASGQTIQRQVFPGNIIEEPVRPSW